MRASRLTVVFRHGDSKCWEMDEAEGVVNVGAKMAAAIRKNARASGVRRLRQHHADDILPRAGLFGQQLVQWHPYLSWQEVHGLSQRDALRGIIVTLRTG